MEITPNFETKIKFNHLNNMVTKGTNLSSLTETKLALNRVVNDLQNQVYNIQEVIGTMNQLEKIEKGVGYMCKKTQDGFVEGQIYLGMEDGWIGSDNQGNWTHQTQIFRLATVEEILEAHKNGII